RDDGGRDARSRDGAARLRAPVAAHHQDRLQGDGGADLRWNAVDQKPVTRGDAVLMTAVLEYCVHELRREWRADSCWREIAENSMAHCAGVAAGVGAAPGSGDAVGAWTVTGATLFRATTSLRMSVTCTLSGY